MSEAHAGVIESYLRAGGKVIVEGEGIKSETIQKLAGVRPTGSLEQWQGEVKGEAPFPFHGLAEPVENQGAEVLAQSSDGAGVVFSQKVGAGRLLYTPLVLSEKVTYEESAAALLKGLVENLAGPPPIVLRTSSGAIDSNVLSDGKSYLLAAYNRALVEGEAEVHLNLPDAPEVLVEFSTGNATKCENRMDLRLPSGEVSFFYLGSREDFHIPQATDCPQQNALCYTSSPGKEILELELFVEEEDQKKTKKREKEEEEGVSYVAVLTDKGKESANKEAWVKGDEGIYAAIKGKRGLQVELIWDLKPETIAFYDAVLIAHIGHAALPPVMGRSWGQTIRKYVLDGGSVLLCHHAVGYPSLCRAPFPEVGEPTGAYIAAVKDMEIKEAHPIANAESMKRMLPDLARDPAFQDQFEQTVFRIGEMFKCSYPDYLPLKPGAEGKVIVRAAQREGVGGEPVVVAGRAGKGKVLLSGMALGAKSNTEDGVSKGEEKVLINAAYWLTEK